MAKKTSKKKTTRRKSPTRKAPTSVEREELRPLTDRQARFVDHYIVSLHATNAAKEAGYSEDTAESQASQLLKKPQVAAAIQKAKDARSERVAVTADNVLREYAALAFSNVSLYTLDDDGRLSPKEGVDPLVMRAVQRVKRRVTYTKKGDKIVEGEFALWSKDNALSKLADHLGICTKTQKLEVTESLYDLIAGAEAEEDDGDEG